MLIFGNDTLHNKTDTVSDLFVAKYDGAGNALWGRQSSNGHMNSNPCITTDAIGDAYIVGQVGDTSHALVFNTDSLVGVINFLTKYDSSGNILLAKEIGNYFGRVNYIIWDNTNHLNICGYFADTFMLGSVALVDSTPRFYPGSTNAYIAKLDTAANVIWARKAGGLTFFSSLAADPWGNLSVTGKTREVLYDYTPFAIIQPFPGYTIGFYGDYDVVFAGYDASGNLRYVSCVGSVYDDAGGGVTIDTMGRIYVAGYFRGTSMAMGGDVLTCTNGIGNMFVARFNPLLPLGTTSVTSPSCTLSVFPNPSHNLFIVTVVSPATEPATIIITNMLGEKIKEFTTITNQQTQIQLSAPPGMYFITAITNSQTTTSKIVVQ